MSRVRLSQLILIVLMMVLASCQVAVDIDLEVFENGAGTVTAQAMFDAEATETLGGVADQLRIDDLEAASWDVTINEAEAGSTEVIAVKQVTSPEQWQQVLNEIVGPGVFTDVTVETDDGFATSSRRLAFGLDLSEGWDLFVDDQAALIDGDSFATLIDGRNIDDIITTSVSATVAGDAHGPQVQQQTQPRFGDPEPVRISLVSNSENSTAILLRWIAIALFSLFLLATVLTLTGIVLQRRADSDRPAPTPTSLASRVPGSPLHAEAIAGATAVATDDVRLVVVEPLTVLYEPPLFMTTFVLSFVRDCGGTGRADQILDAHTAAVLGSMSTADFWRACGSADDPEALDAAYVDQRVMRKSAVGFLSEMERRRIPVAAVTTDAATWSRQLRDRDRLSKVWPWLVSGDVGATGRDVGLFEVLHRESGVAFQHCLYIDTDEERLDLARELGMKTALLVDSKADEQGQSVHPIVRGLKALT